MEWDRRRNILIRDVQEHKALPTGHGGMGFRSLGEARIQASSQEFGVKLLCLSTNICAFVFSFFGLQLL